MTRRLSNGKVLTDLKEAADKAERRIYQLMDVIDAKDAIIEEQMIEIAHLKKRNAELEGKDSIWLKVEE